MQRKSSRASGVLREWQACLTPLQSLCASCQSIDRCPSLSNLPAAVLLQADAVLRAFNSRCAELQALDSNIFVTLIVDLQAVLKVAQGCDTLLRCQQPQLQVAAHCMIFSLGELLDSGHSKGVWRPEYGDPVAASITKQLVASGLLPLLPQHIQAAAEQLRTTPAAAYQTSAVAQLGCCGSSTTCSSGGSGAGRDPDVRAMKHLAAAQSMLLVGGICSRLAAGLPHDSADSTAAAHQLLTVTTSTAHLVVATLQHYSDVLQLVEAGASPPESLARLGCAALDTAYWSTLSASSDSHGQQQHQQHHYVTTLITVLCVALLIQRLPVTAQGSSSTNSSSIHDTASHNTSSSRCRHNRSSSSTSNTLPSASATDKHSRQQQQEQQAPSSDQSSLLHALALWQQLLPPSCEQLLQQSVGISSKALVWLAVHMQLQAEAPKRFAEAAVPAVLSYGSVLGTSGSWDSVPDELIVRWAQQQQLVAVVLLHWLATVPNVTQQLDKCLQVAACCRVALKYCSALQIQHWKGQGSDWNQHQQHQQLDGQGGPVPDSVRLPPPMFKQLLHAALQLSQQLLQVPPDPSFTPEASLLFSSGFRVPVSAGTLGLAEAVLWVVGHANVVAIPSARDLVGTSAWAQVWAPYTAVTTALIEAYARVELGPGSDANNTAARRGTAAAITYLLLVLCKPASPKHHTVPGPLLLHALQADPGSPLQLQLFSLLCSSLKVVARLPADDPGRFQVVDAVLASTLSMLRALAHTCLRPVLAATAAPAFAGSNSDNAAGASGTTAPNSLDHSTGPFTAHSMLRGLGTPPSLQPAAQRAAADQGGSGDATTSTAATATDQGSSGAVAASSTNQQQCVQAMLPWMLLLGRCFLELAAVFQSLLYHAARYSNRNLHGRGQEGEGEGGSACERLLRTYHVHSAICAALSCQQLLCPGSPSESVLQRQQHLRQQANQACAGGCASSICSYSGEMLVDAEEQFPAVGQQLVECLVAAGCDVAALQQQHLAADKAVADGFGFGWHAMAAAHSGNIQQPLTQMILKGKWQQAEDPCQEEYEAVVGTPGGPTEALLLALQQSKPFNKLAERLQAVGSALSTIPLKQACNNPVCINLARYNEQKLVSGRGCTCGSCRTARYCSKVCQKQHWSLHRPVCRALARAAALGTPSLPTTASIE